MLPCLSRELRDKESEQRREAKQYLTDSKPGSEAKLDKVWDFSQGRWQEQKEVPRGPWGGGRPREAQTLKARLGEVSRRGEEAAVGGMSRAGKLPRCGLPWEAESAHGERRVSCIPSRGPRSKYLHRHIEAPRRSEQEVDSVGGRIKGSFLCY